MSQDRIEDVLKDIKSNQTSGEQKTKLVGSTGADIDAVNVHTGNTELRVFSAGHVCLENSSNATLGANEIFTGSSWQNCLDYSEIIISVNSDKDSATDGCVIQWSADGVTVHEDDVFTIYANKGKTFSFPCNRKYIRIKYTNGSVAQGTFVLDTYLKRFASKGSSHRLKDDLVEEDDAIVTKTLIAGKTTAAGGAIVNVKVNPSGALTVDVGASVLPTGASTSTLQTSGAQKTQVVSIDGATGVTVEARKQTPTGNAMNVQIGPGDVISNIPIVLDYDHHQLHEGETWRWSVYVSSLASGSSKDIRLVVPNITIPVGLNPVARVPHLRMEVISDAFANFYLYEGGTFTGNGTQRTPISVERNGTYTPYLQIYEDPTPNVIGTQIYQGVIFATKTSGGGLDTPMNEFILKNNTAYLFRLTSGTTGLKALIRLFWYEDLGV